MRQHGEYSRAGADAVLGGIRRTLVIANALVFILGTQTLISGAEREWGLLAGVRRTANADSRCRRQSLARLGDFELRWGRPHVAARSSQRAGPVPAGRATAA